MRVSTAGSNYIPRETMHAYPHTLPLADTNCIILTVHQQLYMEKGDSPHFDHHHEVLENKKGPQWTYFKPWGGPSRPIQATVHRVAANTHGPPTNDSFWYTWRQDPLVSERHLRTTSHGRGLLYTCVFPQPLELQPRHTFALHWHLRTTSHRSRKRSCWFTLTHCFFRRTSKAKTMQKMPKSCQPPAKAQQAGPS